MLIFGDKWILKHGERPTGEWASVLLSFDEKQIATGISRMRRDAEAKIKAGDEAWPPIPFEFAVLCKTQSSLYFSSPRELPPPRASKATALRWLKKIRGGLS